VAEEGKATCTQEICVRLGETQVNREVRNRGEFTENS